MRPRTRHEMVLIASLAFAVLAMPATALSHPPKTRGTAQQNSQKGMAVAFPWVFKNGTGTARTTALKSAEEILRKAGYASIPGDVAESVWASNGLPKPSLGHMPTSATLRTFGKALRATKVVYGSVSWHTRSIWVNLGPKTISTATVNAYVFDVASGKVVFKKTGVKGRSDEKSNGYKIAADILLTPLVTAASGGPATPREQRAAQISLGLALHAWAKTASATK